VDALVDIAGLWVDVPVGDSMRTVLRGVDLQIGAGEAVGLVGESGSGKSMTARALSRLLPDKSVTRGTVTVRGRNVLVLEGRALRDYRRGEIAMVFQDPRAYVNPVRTIGDFMTEPMRGKGMRRVEATALAEQLLGDVQLTNPKMLLSRYPHELSGGMLQRVMIAAAIGQQPRLILADEPTTSLDVTVQAEVMVLLDRLRREHSVAMLFITHDLELAAAVCDRTAVMYAGAVVEVQRASSLHEEPLHPYTQALLRSRPQLERSAGRLTAIPGTPLAPYEVHTGCSFQPRCPFARERCIDERPQARKLGPGTVACHFAGRLETVAR
jgi:oligopeptide/dipeptide ABC transporter ATP-binding protein